MRTLAWVLTWALLLCTTQARFVGAQPHVAQAGSAAAPGGASATGSVPGSNAGSTTGSAAAGLADVAPRRAYNQARSAFAGGDWAAAEAAFLSARDRAAGDDELRFRSAFNLALTYAQKATSLTKEKPQEAVATLRQSAAWFRDAVRARPDDGDARHNLEVVLRRMQQLEDQLNQEQNALQARLARVIADERTLRDRVRALIGRVNAAGAAAEPLSFHTDFEELSTFQRTLLSDAGAILDLAGDKRDQLGQKAEKDRTPEEAGQLIQLQNLEHYLNIARGTMADVARLLRRLQGDRAHRQSDVAVTGLKRAMEQLLDPVTVLKGLVGDQTATMGQTRALSEIRGRSQQLPVGAAAGKDAGAAAAAPVWLTQAWLGEQQKDLQPRLGELVARLQAGVEGASKEPAAGSPGPDGKPADPQKEAERRRVLEAAKQAIPILHEATAAMAAAVTALSSTGGGDPFATALRSQEAATAAMLRALERFSGLRDLIELAYGEQAQMVSLLSPEAKAALGKLSEAERGALLSDAVTGGAARNVERLGRLKTLFAEELEALKAAPGQAAGGQAAGGKEEEERRAAERARYEAAEARRAQAEEALTQLSALIAKRNPALLPTAEAARKHLEELRRLFFSIVEHLKDLLRAQGDTHDRTGSAQTQKDEAERLRRVGPLVGTQEGHATLGKALAEALAAQADQAEQAARAAQQGGAAGAGGAAGGAAGGPSQMAQIAGAQQAGKKLSEAAGEVGKAHDAMREAARLMKPEQEGAAQSMPLDLEPPMEQQKKAMGHLDAAIRILEPPNEDQQKQKQQQKQQQQNEEQQLSQEQAARRLQQIRDREAERQRKQPQPHKPEPVEKDW